MSASSYRGIDLTAEQIKTIILTVLDDQKAEDIETIDLHGQSSLADYMIIANGRSTRQVVGLAGKIKEKLSEYGLKIKTEGAAQGDWVVVDCLDVIVHLFRPEVREFYGIEKMWRLENLPAILSLQKHKTIIV